LALLQDFLGCQDLRVGVFVFVLDLNDALLVFLLKLVELLVIHFTDGTLVVGHIRLDTLSFEVGAEHLVV